MKYPRGLSAQQITRLVGEQLHFVRQNSEITAKSRRPGETANGAKGGRRWWLRARAWYPERPERLYLRPPLGLVVALDRQDGGCHAADERRLRANLRRCEGPLDHGLRHLEASGMDDRRAAAARERYAAAAAAKVLDDRSNPAN